ncbi:tripartite tricarboxylate transporter permease [Alkalispirochaeta americana]|uniref:tripartite tricarboxylate transporter permease n=1 Tax=Alkalispirochaeta americana TaxID=159291 RepID=UPI000970A790|nr:tripartite tricarboxylate transporter permease [Alkalispirochaeta americana]
MARGRWPSGGAYIPTITLGIPGNTVTAVILAGLITHGISPGPSLFRNEVQLVYAIFIGLFVSNISCLYCSTP